MGKNIFGGHMKAMKYFNNCLEIAWIGRKSWL